MGCHQPVLFSTAVLTFSNISGINEDVCNIHQYKSWFHYYQQFNRDVLTESFFPSDSLGQEALKHPTARCLPLDLNRALQKTTLICAQISWPLVRTQSCTPNTLPLLSDFAFHNNLDFVAKCIIFFLLLFLWLYSNRKIMCFFHTPPRWSTRC